MLTPRDFRQLNGVTPTPSPEDDGPPPADKDDAPPPPADDDVPPPPVRLQTARRGRPLHPRSARPGTSGLRGKSNQL